MTSTNLTHVINKIRTAGAVAAVAGTFTLVTVLAPLQRVYAATGATITGVSNPVPSPKISFTFDDGLASAVTQAAPTLAKYGFTGTDYVITGCVGMTKAPNTCRANTDATYMDWSQIAQLKDTFGWEIGSHTVDHYCLASSGDGTDCQTNVLTPQQLDYELTQSKIDLAAHGIDAKDMSTPYGDYTAPVLAQIAKYYQSMRGFQDTGFNSWPYSEYLVRDQHIEGRTKVADVEKMVDTAIANNQWLVLTFHDIKTKASKNPDDYEYSTSGLNQIAAYVKSKNVQVTTVNDAFVNSDSNLLTNGSFNGGIASGWTTDSPSNVTADSGNNGDFPDSMNSVKFIAGGKEVHLFSPKVAVDSNTTYLLKNYANVSTLSSGEFGFYVDEYDGFGNWISGQYKAAARSVWANQINFSYTPTSANVRSASLQVLATANSGITAYLDNSQWFPLSTTAPTPPPVQTNLVANGTFDDGIADGWTTNSSTTITSDSGGNGSPSNPVNSVKLTSTTINRHLFSPIVAVDSTSTYTLSSYLNLKQISSGEIGFYIDEYDVSGNWVSGQYKTGVSSIGSGDVSFNYTPTSTNVKGASLQIIVMGNSNTLAYIDDIRWFTN